jgi:hypothetical protein
LGHDQLNILVLEARSINLLSVILVLILLIITGINSLALSVSVIVVVVVIVARMIMSGVVVSLSSSELLGSRSLSLGVKILNLGLTEDARCLVRIARRC